MNVKILVFVICVKAIIYLLLYNLHNSNFIGTFWVPRKIWKGRQPIRQWKWVNFGLFFFYFIFSLSFSYLQFFSGVLKRLSIMNLLVIASPPVRTFLFKTSGYFFFAIYSSSLSKVYTNIQRWILLLIQSMYQSILSKHNHINAF